MTPKVRLRPVEIKDLDNIMTWVNDPEVVKNLTNFDHKITREEEKEFVEKLIKNENERVFSIEDINGDYIGQIGINQIYWKAKLGRISIVIGSKKHQGKGYAQEALKEILKIAFKEMRLHKVWAITFKTNERMQHILEKIGFIKEGVLREEYFLKDEFHDVVRLSMLDKEYYRIMEARK